MNYAHQRLKPAPRLGQKMMLVGYQCNFRRSQIQNGQFIASEMEHFFREFPVSLIMQGLIECIFWAEI
ncbi:hypothetical protein [Anabaena azotica]|uniref:Uncharacterized protein n=1 Tax=Anabaena azotica FACHB-119 TaxID=947527 RepID=A0ABR8CZH5_9NOST|nr:hypothetical protein [Anabaena azotica]MBD2500067.1 hypothetical protein [Anabaena azotica FACHB-119]